MFLLVSDVESDMYVLYIDSYKLYGVCGVSCQLSHDCAWSSLLQRLCLTTALTAFGTTSSTADYTCLNHPCRHSQTAPARSVQESVLTRAFSDLQSFL